MNTVIKEKLGGLKKSMNEFQQALRNFTVDENNIMEFTELLAEHMRKLNYDCVSIDMAGNVIGKINGYGCADEIVIISHMDYEKNSGVPEFKSGIISALYAGALIKHALVPLDGNVRVCCIPRAECCDFGIEYLFEQTLKDEARLIKGILLSEPTGLNLHVGHKGRMEYNIKVKGRFDTSVFGQKGIEILSELFPLLNELKKVSLHMPRDYNLGTSSLKIKDVRYNGLYGGSADKEIEVVVDRIFVPEESSDLILDKAASIARNIYKENQGVTVNTALAQRKIKTGKGYEAVLNVRHDPWLMPVNHPFVASSMEVLNENGFKAALGYWHSIVTEGSYTFSRLNIPTIGFGAGREDSAEPAGAGEIFNSVYGQTLIIYRRIGMQSFGWSADAI